MAARVGCRFAAYGKGGCKFCAEIVGLRKFVLLFIDSYQFLGSKDGALSAAGIGAATQVWGIFPSIVVKHWRNSNIRVAA